MTVTIKTGARIHAGFCNLSLEHDRLYGSVGVGLDRPQTIVHAKRADKIRCEQDLAREYAETACELFEVPGVTIEVESTIPRHVGLGSGTQMAMAVLSAVGRVYDHSPSIREYAPALGRGGRSGIGVGAFLQGGFLLDAGQPTADFTTQPPSVGSWNVPAVVSRHDVPADWRFVLVIPEIERGRSDDIEDESMRTTIETADGAIADEIAGVVLRRLLPGMVEGTIQPVGEALETIGRMNGRWFASEQGGLYRPSLEPLIEAIAGHDEVAGASQSSWGPTIYALTGDDSAQAVAATARSTLEDHGIDGTVFIGQPDNEGATVSRS